MHLAGRLALLAVSALALVGCGRVRNCKSGTAFLQVELSGAALEGDSLTLAIAVNGGPPRTTTLRHNPGSASGTVEIDFSGRYPTNARVNVIATVTKSGTPVATGTTAFTALAGCSSATLTVGSSIGTGDAGGNTGGDAGDGGAPADLTGAVAVTIGTPAMDIYTHGSVNVQVVVTGPADSVALLVDGNPLATVTAPYQYTWDTSGVAEGPHMLVARATHLGTSHDSSARTIVVDRTPPTVTARVPTPGNSNVELLAPITVSFSEPMLPASVNDQALTVTVGGTAVSRGPTLSADGKTLTITPDLSAATLPANLVVTLNPSLTDLAGNPVTQPATAWSWSIPIWQSLDTAALPTSGVKNIHRIAVDGSGNISLAYFQTLITGNNSYVIAYDGTNWNTLGGGPVTSKDISDYVVSPRGDMFVANTRGPLTLQTLSGGMWQTLASQPLSSLEYSMTVDNTGAPIVATVSAKTLTIQRYVNGAWSQMGQTLAADTGSTSKILVRVSGAGVPYVVFNQISTVAPTHEWLRVYSFSTNTNMWQSVTGDPIDQGAGVSGYHFVQLGFTFGIGSYGLISFFDAANWYLYQISFDGTLTHNPLPNGLKLPSTTTIPDGVVIGVTRTDGLLWGYTQPNGPQLLSWTLFTEKSGALGPWNAIGSDPLFTCFDFPSLATDLQDRPLMAWTDGNNALHVWRGNQPLP
jgi:hypothetical protein